MSKRAQAKFLVQAKAEVDQEYAQDVGCISCILQYIDDLTDSELDGELGDRVGGLESIWVVWDEYIPYYLQAAWKMTRSEEGMQFPVLALWRASIHITMEIFSKSHRQQSPHAQVCAHD